MRHVNRTVSAKVANPRQEKAPLYTKAQVIQAVRAILRFAPIDRARRYEIGGIQMSNFNDRDYRAAFSFMNHATGGRYEKELFAAYLKAYKVAGSERSVSDEPKHPPARALFSRNALRGELDITAIDLMQEAMQEALWSKRASLDDVKKFYAGFDAFVGSAYPWAQLSLRRPGKPERIVDSW